MLQKGYHYEVIVKSAAHVVTKKEARDIMKARDIMNTKLIYVTPSTFLKKGIQTIEYPCLTFSFLLVSSGLAET